MHSQMWPKLTTKETLGPIGFSLVQKLSSLLFNPIYTFFFFLSFRFGAIPGDIWAMLSSMLFYQAVLALYQAVLTSHTGFLYAKLSLQPSSYLFSFKEAPFFFFFFFLLFLGTRGAPTSGSLS